MASVKPSTVAVAESRTAQMPVIIILLILCSLTIWSAPIRSCLGLIFSSCVLALFLDLPAIRLERRGIPRLYAIVLVTTIFTAVLAMAGWLFYPALMTEFQDLGVQINKAQASVSGKADTAGPTVTLFWRNLTAGLVELLRSSHSESSSVLSSLFYWPMLLVLGFFIMKDGHRIKKATLSWIPNTRLEMTVTILHRLRRGAKRYLVREVSVAFGVGLLSAVALHLLGVRFSMLLGASAGLAQMVPYLGVALGAMPAMLVVLVDGGALGAVLAVAVAFASIEMIKNLALSSLRIPRSVKLSPLSTLLALLVGTQVLGIPGMLLAVPIATLSKVGILEVKNGLKRFGVL